MADNITAPGAGAVLATDDVGGVHYPRTKLAIGADGAAADVHSGNPLPVAPAASESYLGKIGGDLLSVSVTPVVSGTPDYAAGEAIGGIMQFSGLVRTSGGAAIIQAARIFSKVAITAQIDLLLFNANPGSTTVTDNAAFDLNSADFAKLIGAIPITEWIAAGTPCIGQNVGRGQPVKPATGTDIYGVLVARGAVNLAAASDIVVTLLSIPG